MTDERRIERMAGCACLGKALLGSTVIMLLSVACISFLRDCKMGRPPRNGWSLRAKATIKDLKTSIETFNAEYGALPTADTGKNTDHQLRSRGQLINELCLSANAKLNFKKILFIELPIARNQKDGIWQNGSEWVLGDHWGEPFYIILDTNEDNVIANPEFGADQSDPKYAEKCRNSPPPPTLPAKVIIYSSGPDRDPKT